MMHKNVGMHDKETRSIDLLQYVINTAEMGDGGVVGVRALYESDPGETFKVFQRFVLRSIIEDPYRVIFGSIPTDRPKAELDRIGRLVVRNENCNSILHR
jgi:hypothetical protein